MTDINVTARRIKKGSKTFVEVRGLGASRDAVELLGGKRAERAKVVVVCEQPAYSRPLHAVGLRADAEAARKEAHRLLHPDTGPSRRGRCGFRYDNSWKQPAAYAAAIEVVDET